MILHSKAFRSKMFSLVFLTSLTVFLHVVSFGAGEVDTSFNAYLADVPRGVISHTVVQPDGKIIITGEFKLVNGAAKPNIVRLNADGSLDPTFNPPIMYSSGASNPIHGIALQADGKIVLSGFFANPRNAVARLNADGSPDTAFNSSPALNNLWYGDEVEIAPDGRIVVSVFKFSTSSTRPYLMLLNPDGTLSSEIDTGTGVQKLAIQPDGKIIVIGNGVQRLNPNLSADNSFTTITTNGAVDDIAFQPDGKILLGGDFTQINGSPLIRLARINPNGTVDTTFNINAEGASGAVHALVYLPGGKILIGGDFFSYNGVLRYNVALLNSDGSLDMSFTAARNFFRFYDLAVQSDGKIIGGGTPLTEIGSAVARLNTDGALDTSFRTIVGNFGTGQKVIVQPDNKILVGGGFNNANGTARKNLVRFNADGTLDTGFNTNVLLYTTYSFELLPDGKILASDQNVVYRLNSDGTPDVTYGSDGGGSTIDDIQALPDGRALVAKGDKLFRHNTNGTIDPSFDVRASGFIFKVTRQPDGKILIGGLFTHVNGTIRGSIARLNANGTIDASFNPPGGATGGFVREIALQTDGKVIVGGDFTGINFDTNRKYLARLNSDGTLDTNFVQTIDNAVYTVKLQPNGKILIGGAFSIVNNLPRSRYARLNANGSPDISFYVGTGADFHVRDIDLQSDGKIIMVGMFERVNNIFRPGIVRMLNPPAAARVSYDYDGDGKADISVFRPSENKWYILRSSDGLVTQQIFAVSGDIPVPSDFDGDGKTDMAIYRSSSADWWSLSSVSGGQNYAHWGEANVSARPSDFDGDGKADYIFFLPANSTWYRYGTSVGASYVQFGLSGDKPVTGDFDGDGKSDVAIYRPSTGDWWWQSSVDNIQRAIHWGISTDIPAPADYDGDGRTDFAVYRASAGVWYIYNSSNNSQTIYQFGLAEDKPVAADFDGDGKADIAVFRPSTGVWYLQRSTAGFTALQFGISTDIPTENAFVP